MSLKEFLEIKLDGRLEGSSLRDNPLKGMVLTTEEGFSKEEELCSMAQLAALQIGRDYMANRRREDFNLKYAKGSVSRDELEDLIVEYEESMGWKIMDRDKLYFFQMPENEKILYVNLSHYLDESLVSVFCSR